VSRLRGVTKRASALTELPGRAFQGNQAWLAAGPGRASRHQRELSRLELSYHGFLVDGSVDNPSGWDFLRSYQAEFPARTSEWSHEWHPYSVSNRIGSWLGFLAKAPHVGQETLASDVAGCIREMTDMVDWMPERDLGANHLLKNLWAVALSDSVLEPDSSRRESSVKAYVAELERQMLPDGGHYELCPMYHAKVLVDAAMLIRMLGKGSRVSARIEETRRRGLEWLEEFRISPGAWANFNDSWDIPDISSALWSDDDLAPRLGLRHLQDSGFIRGESPGGWRWLFDVGGVGPDSNPGHCHSDLLSLVVNRGDEPVVLDPGVLHYSPNDERGFLRSCHSHNGPCLAERDHSEMIGSFRIGRAARCEGASTRSGADADADRAVAHHSGYKGFRLGRTVTAGPRHLHVEDRWEPGGPASGSPWSRFLWAASIRDLRSLEIGTDSIGFRFPAGHPSGDLLVTIRIRGAEKPRLCVAESFASGEFGRTRAATETVVTAGKSKGTIVVETVIEPG